MSLDAENEWGSNDHPSCLLDHLGSEDPEFEGMLDRIDLTKSLRCLNRREQRIIYLKFYSGLPQREIAERLGMSQMHVSRLQRGALNKLRLDLAA